MVHDFFVRNTTAGPVVGFSDTQPVRSRSAALDGTASHGEKEPVCKWLVNYCVPGICRSSCSTDPQALRTGHSLCQSWSIRTAYFSGTVEGDPKGI